MKSITDAQLQIRDAIKALGESERSREVSIAITHLETAQLWLMKSHLEAGKAKASKPSEPTPDIVIMDPCSVPPLSEMPWWERALFGCF